MTLHLNNSGSWATIAEMAVNNSGSWTWVAHAYVNNSGSWTEFYTLSLPGILSLSVTDASYCDTAAPVYVASLSWSATDSRWPVHIYRDGVLIDSVAAGTTTYDDTSIASSGFYDYEVRYYYSDLEGFGAVDTPGISNPCP